LPDYSGLQGQRNVKFSVFFLSCFNFNHIFI
jgi:hypothetical protein